MKRIIVLASLLLAASACSPSPAPSNANAPTPPANTTTAVTPSPAATPSDSGAVAKEKEIWDNIKKKDPNAFAAMLAEDFVYVSNDGVYDKAGTVNGIKQIEATDITLSDWKTVTLNKDAAVVTYTVDMKGTSGGQPIPPGAMRAGSLWVNRGGNWVGVFHQDTPVEEPPTKPAESTKPAAKPTATAPAQSKPAEAVSDDPVAREKQVWDAIKKKDYDRFASFLAEDQIEVFGWGVNDKAGSVNGVKEADLSKAVLSDFKATKISDDVAIVTYMVKGSGDLSPSGARASTIWVKRDGKWLAVYHHDTTVKPATAKK
ncbi:MAG: hypothetical protein QOH25_1822 [Acidobacteriota bacterium]|jgi:hypothetical protein|nr:hypothetical protein [Acidobacteriota bacterium]